MSHVGRYSKCRWMRKRLCDVLGVESKLKAYFLLDENFDPTGDHFMTLKEMYAFVDSKEAA